MIDFEEGVECLKPSLDVEEMEGVIAKSGLTGMTDTTVELIKERGGRNL